jgi:hypothetical protein
VKEVFRLISSESDEAFAPPSAFFEAREKLLTTKALLDTPLQSVTELLDTAEPNTGVLQLTDQSAERLSTIRGDLLKVSAEIQKHAEIMIQCQQELHERQERPLEGWVRLNESEPWQNFSTYLRSQLQMRLNYAWMWYIDVLVVHENLVELAKRLDRVFIEPWPNARHQYRRSARGLWRRFMAWASRKPYQTPLRVAAEDSKSLRTIVDVLHRALDRIKAMPSVGPIGGTLMAEANGSRVEVHPKSSESV